MSVIKFILSTLMHSFSSVKYVEYFFLLKHEQNFVLKPVHTVIKRITAEQAT